MTLPQGYKVFTDGSVLTADEIVGYLQQGILVFDDASARTTALTGNLREGMYSYLKSDNTTYVYDGTAWQRVGKQDVETDKNFLAFTGSGGTTVPAWATKMYYVVVRGGSAGAAGQAGTPATGATGNGGAGGAGGQVLQGDTAVTGGTSLTITVGGAASNSSVAISGGSTFTASSTGAGGGAANAGAGSDGTLPSAPFNGFRLGGGGGAGAGFARGGMGGNGGANGGGHGGSNSADGAEGGPKAGRAGYANTGGGGGGGGGHTTTPTGAGGAGGSGLVLLYFS
jgi:hypothetical protein